MSELPDGLKWRAASFRNAPFEVKDVERSGGRRGPVHQVPQRDDAAADDQGMKTPEFTFECYVHGDDYQSKRDALIAALETKGAGELVHPHYGRLLVFVPQYRVRESTSALGKASFSITCQRVGEAISYPSAAVNSGHALTAATSRTEAVVLDDFTKKFDVSGQPDFVEADAFRIAEDFIARVGNAGAMPSGQLTALIRKPLALGQRVLGLYSQATNIVPRFGGFYALASQLGLNGWRRGIDAALSFGSYTSRSEAIAWNTPARQAQATNLAAFDGLVQRGALLEVARQVQAAQPSSRQAAVALAPSIIAAFDTQIATAPRAVFRPLADLRNATWQHLDSVALDAGEELKLNLAGPTPSLVIANRLYGDEADCGRGRWQDIARRNPEQKDPGYLRGAVKAVVSEAGR